MSVAQRMSDRLQELLQQRALIKEHLTWLDSEIAAASGQPSPPAKNELQGEERPPAPVARSTVSAPLPAIAPHFAADKRATEEAQMLLEKLSAEEREKKPPGKTGCWLFFAGTLAMLALGAWALLHHFYS